MPIENIVAAAELSATTDPVGNCMGASPRAACAMPDHYPGAEGKSTTPAGRSPRGARSSNDTPVTSSSSRRCVSIADGAAPMIVVTD
ncbi:hypothetical protein [Burkholderia cepacia]|uniref:hypothetical protein n=1 Tax=Burkholderia cepacia TaxID=292 RepID=UPI0015882EE2|nr:hypothetical protein [Burkholderia cepacia]